MAQIEREHSKMVKKMESVSKLTKMDHKKDKSGRKASCKAQKIIEKDHGVYSLIQ